MANMVELELSQLAQASSHARAATSTPVDWSHYLYIHAHPLQSKFFIVLDNILYLHPQLLPINHLLPKVGCVECDSGTCTDAMVGCVGHNSQAYLMQQWGHVGHDGQVCGKMQWLGVWDTMVGHEHPSNHAR